MNRLGFVTVPLLPLAERRVCRVPRGANFLALTASNASSMVDMHYFYEEQLHYDEKNNLFGPVEELELVNANYYLLPTGSEIPPGEDLAVFGYAEVPVNKNSKRVIFGILEDNSE